MNIAKPIPAAVTPAFDVQWLLLRRLVLQLLAGKAHADVVLQLKDGGIQLLRVNQSFLPSNIPQV